MTWRTLTPASEGVATAIQTDGQNLIIRRRQDVAAVVEQNAAERKEAPRSMRGQDRVRVARLPPVVLAKLMTDGTLRGDAGDQERIRWWLNDPDNVAFRTRGGRV